jgi:hypothetical protein
VSVPQNVNDRYDVNVPKSESSQVSKPPADVRVPVATRIRISAVKQIDDFAAEENRPRSAMLRILLAEAVTERLRKRGRR